MPHLIKSVRKRITKMKRWKLFCLIGLIVILFAGFLYILKDLPSPTKLASGSLPQSTQILDRNGVLLYTIYTQKNQTFIPLSSIPKTVQQATIAIEDKDFYNHGPIDLRGIARSLVSIVFHRELQGGSTLTQQLVKNSLLTPERTITRKVKEAILSFATELLYPKSRILEMYLNQIPYGGTAYGIEAAAQTYFGKHAKDLDLAQSTLLAGLPESPTTYSPFGSHPELAKRRQSFVIKAMLGQNYIKKEEADKALSKPLKYEDVLSGIKAPHFVFYVKDLLSKLYGTEIVEQGGLKVITSLDSSIQQFAQDAVATEVAKLKSYNVSNGASLVTNPGTGEILAMVGSHDYFDEEHDGNVNVTLALRQPGSSIKPINYALGLMNGYTGATPFADQKICFPNPGGKPPYCPVNYDGKWHGILQMRFALANSVNIPAVKMLKVNGVSAMIATSKAMGITTFNNASDYGLSLALGSGEVTMLDMATAFGVLANGGYRVNLNSILKVIDKNGKEIKSFKPLPSPIFGQKVLPEGVSYIITNILSDNGARIMAFGENSPLRIKDFPVAVKTGTTNDFRDNWTIGYTPSYVVAVWVGNNDNSQMSGFASGITGAAPIWHTIMAHLISDKPPHSLQRPPNIIQKQICSTSGLLPPAEGTPNRCPTRLEYFITGTEPARVDPGTQKVLVDKTTNGLAARGQTDNVEQRDELVVTDPTGDSYCLTCPHPIETPAP